MSIDSSNSSDLRGGARDCRTRDVSDTVTEALNRRWAEPHACRKDDFATAASRRVLERIEW